MSTESEIRAWAISAGVPVSPRGRVAKGVIAAPAAAQDGTLSHVETVELASRIDRPDLFALADDLAEAELARRGEWPPTESREVASELHTFADWVVLRDTIATVIQSKLTAADKAEVIAAAESLILDGWVVAS